MSKLGEQVGALIRHHRKRKGWSQDRLAAEADRTVGMINRLERGRVGMTFETLEALAVALDVAPRDFFEAGSVVVKSDQDDHLVRLFDRVTALSPDDIKWVDDLVRIALSRKVRG